MAFTVYTLLQCVYIHTNAERKHRTIETSDYFKVKMRLHILKFSDSFYYYHHHFPHDLKSMRTGANVLFFLF